MSIKKWSNHTSGKTISNFLITTDKIQILTSDIVLQPVSLSDNLESTSLANVEDLLVVFSETSPCDKDFSCNEPDVNIKDIQLNIISGETCFSCVATLYLVVI